MGNMHLVTGYAGKEHVKASDHGSFNAALISSGCFVMDIGSKLAISKISDNMVRIADGEVLMQGRHGRVENGAVVDLAVESGQNGYKRRDLVCVRYLQNADTGVEDCNLIVIRGNPVAASPSDPEYVNGDIIGGALQKDFPLYRLNLNGTSIESIDTLCTVFPSIENKRKSIDEELRNVWSTFTKYDSGLVKIATGSYTGTGTTGSGNKVVLNFPFTPKVVLIHDAYNLTGIYDGFAVYGAPYFRSGDSVDGILTASWGTTSLSFYAKNAQYQFNTKDHPYYWCAIGL